MVKKTENRCQSEGQSRQARAKRKLVAKNPATKAKRAQGLKETHPRRPPDGPVRPAMPRPAADNTAGAPSDKGGRSQTTIAADPRRRPRRSRLGGLQAMTNRSAPQL